MKYISIRNNIAVALKGIVASWKQIVIAYAIFPVLLANCLGYFYKNVYKPETNIDRINITIIDNDCSKSSEDFKEIFQTKDMKKVFKVSKNGDFIITIPENYEKNLMKLNKIKLKVSMENNVSQNYKNIITSVINDYGKLITENKIISNKILSLSKEDREKIYKDLNSVYSEKILRNNFVKPMRTLNSYENLGADFVNYIIISISIAIAASYKKEKKDGIYKRIMAMPMKKEKIFNVNLVCYYIHSIIYGGLYILGFIITGTAFEKCNFINLLAVLICQSLLITSFSAFIIAFFSDSISVILLTMLLFLQTFLGGGFIPIAEVNNSIYIKISQADPLNIVSEAYKNCMLFNSFTSIQRNLGYIIILSVIIYGIAFLKIKVRWEIN